MWAREHPRVCGENFQVPLVVAQVPGTSLRMRGKRPRCTGSGRSCRNIPAYAGKTGALDGFGLEKRGTSPRMRGKLETLKDQLLPMRNIPAYAGKTNNDKAPAPKSKEHPRVCGENCTRSRMIWATGGTSPRMRGKPAGALGHVVGFRNIPAHAGKTFRFLSCCSRL